MMNNTDTTNTNLYETLARIQAALAIQQSEREQWIADYDNNNK